VLAVQPRGGYGAQEELRSVRVGTGVGHRQHSRSGVLLNEVLIVELVSVDRLSSGSIPIGEVTSLAHELGDHSVKLGVLEVEGLSRLPLAFLPGAQRPEIFRGLRSGVGVQLHHDAPSRSTADGDIEENLRVGRSHLDSLKHKTQKNMNIPDRK